MNKNKKIRIGCASGFWGDTSTAAAQLVNKGNLNYLVFDYLSEVTMSILAGAKMKNSNRGYAADFVKQISPLLHLIKKQGIKIVSNAGGINLESCRDALEIELEKAGVKLEIALVKGDDIIDRKNEFQDLEIVDIEKNQPLPDKVLSMNAYLGAPPIKMALESGADIVITGRCVDTALVLGPLMHEFCWNSTDYDFLASGSLAGHIIECGAQCTGGNYTDWNNVQDMYNIGYPIATLSNDTTFTISKDPNSGGLINKYTIIEQVLYEMGNPKQYISPDVIVDFTSFSIKELSKDTVEISGVKGYKATDTYKVSINYFNGYKASGQLTISGPNALEKAKLTSEIICPGQR